MDADTTSAVKQSLLSWKQAGLARPAIPLHMDVDGDGKTDYLFLDDNDEVMVVGSSEGLDLVNQTDGSGFEAGEELGE